MGKGGDVKRGGSSRFAAAMRRTGGDSDGILDKSSKKEKLRKLSSVGEMDQSNTISKRIKLPKKFFDDSYTVNHASVPRKIRSAMKKRNYESVSPSQNPRNPIHRIEMPSKERKTKLEVDVDESIVEQITKDEEEVMVALVSMAKTLPGNDKIDEINLNNETSKLEASSPTEIDDSKTTCQAPDINKCTNNVSKTEDYVQEIIKKDSKDVTDGKNSLKRCSSHVYICRLIKDMQVTKCKIVNSQKDVKTDTHPENITNGYTDKTSNEAHVAPKPPVPPYFGSPLYDPSQWLRPAFPKQPMWVNQLTPGARYETVPPGSNCIQASMQDVLGSKQQQYKMQLGHRGSGYEENGGLFLVDRSPTLKLTLR